MVENSIADTANYDLMLEEIKDTLGEDAFFITQCLSQGMSKRATAKYLKIAYPRVKELVQKIAVIVDKARAGK